MSRYRVTVDTGGTFSDFVYLDEDTGALSISKLPSTPDDPSRAILAGIENLLADGAAPDEIGYFCHGSTVGTNALLEGKGVTTGLLVTEGFRAIYPVAEQARPYGPVIFDVMFDKPTLLVPNRRTGEVRERIDLRGRVRQPLDEAALRATVRNLHAEGIESIAVCLLFSFLHPAHEARVRDIIREEIPACSISLSSEVLPQIREYYRLSTTVINAYLQPILARYIGELERRLAGAGVTTRQAYIMQSNGGMATFAGAADKAVTTVLSGPAAGVTAGALACRMTGYRNIITFDMGGTSCEVALIRDGEPSVASRGKIDGRDIAVPMMDINTVSAGGGTIAAVDPLRVLAARPASARPGPRPGGLRPRRHAADDHRLQPGAGPAQRGKFPRRAHAARGREGAAGDRERSRESPEDERPGRGRGDHPHHQREDGGGHQGHLHHARPRPARLHAARLRWRRPGACRGDRPRPRHGRGDRAALPGRLFGHRPA